MPSLQAHIAWRCLHSKNSDRFCSVSTWVSIVAVMLAVAATLATVQIQGGLHLTIQNSLRAFEGAPALTAMAYGADQGKNQERAEKIVAAILDEPPEGLISPSMACLITHGGLIHFNGTDASVIWASAVGGPEDCLSGWIARNGGQPPIGDEIWLQKARADELGLSVGDTVELVAKRPGNIPFLPHLRPRTKAFRITRLYTFEDADKRADRVEAGIEAVATNGVRAILPKKWANSMFHQALIQVNGWWELADDADGWREYLDSNFQGGEVPVALGGLREEEKHVNALIRTNRAVSCFVLFLVGVVACFLLMSSLMWMVRERSKDVAVWRTMGLSRWQVRQVFITQGLVVMGVGTGMGAAIGMLISWKFEEIVHLIGAQMEGMQAELSHTSLAWVCAAAFLASIAASWAPAARAARIAPASVLRQD